MTKTDLQLKQDFEQAHRSDPKVKAAHIGLIVDQGSVALLGCCRHDTYPQKWADENAAKLLGGVRTVAQDVTVNLPSIINALIPSLLLPSNTLEWGVFVPKSLQQFKRGLFRFWAASSGTSCVMRRYAQCGC